MSLRMKRTIEIEFDYNDDDDSTIYLGFAVYKDSCARSVAQTFYSRFKKVSCSFIFSQTENISLVLIC